MDEYICNDFQQFLSSHVISWKNSIPYTLEKKGVLELKNREIMEMAHRMFHSQNMKLSFCGEVVCAAYIINHTPTFALTRMTHEWLHRQKVFVSHFCIFGSGGLVHPPHQRQDISLVHSTPHGTLVGYSETFSRILSI